MTKADLARTIYQRHGGLTNQEALRIVDSLFDSIKSRLQVGESVYIVGFGTLEVVQRRPRPGRNPVTGAQIQLPARRALVFRAARTIRQL